MEEIFPLPEDLTPSLEDYLETILILSEEKKIARVKDISRRMGVRTASVVGALKNLENKGYVIHEKYGYVELTEKGKKAAEQVYHRHKILKKFFLGVLDLSEDEAERNACNIEHYLTHEAVERFLKFINFIEECPLGQPHWLYGFREYLISGKRPEDCGKREDRRE